VFRDRCTSPCTGKRTALAPRASKARTDFEQSDIALLAATVVATASIRPGSADGRKTAKFSDSGLAIGHELASAANGLPRWRRRSRTSLPPKTRGRHHAAKMRVRPMRGSIGGGAASSGGKVDGRRSKP
jgi:hypothetical protein